MCLTRKTKSFVVKHRPAKWNHQEDDGPQHDEHSRVPVIGVENQRDQKYDIDPPADEHREIEEGIAPENGSTKGRRQWNQQRKVSASPAEHRIGRVHSVQKATASAT